VFVAGSFRPPATEVGPPAGRVPPRAADSGARDLGPAPERLVPRVVSIFPHDSTAYTQGLLWHQGSLYESTGLYGASRLRRVDPETGAVLQEVALAPRYFGEGLALAGDRLIQITWQEGKAFVYDRETFQRVGELGYTGEGWGLCWDGERLVMSDGSDRLTFRDPRTFEAVGSVRVTRSGRPVRFLNELECVGGSVYANVWQSEEILKIDPATGRVVAVVDASNLLLPQERVGLDVLNGIAWNPETGTFFLTGKLWPKTFEVRFEPAR
jgi:glutaminyl-peptide cyclotransferase